MNFKIFNAIKDDEELKVNEKYFYCLIINYSNEKGYAYPSYDQLMKDMNTTNRTTISSIIKRLVEKGYIEYVKGNSVKNANRYYPLKYVTLTDNENATSNEIVTSDEIVTSSEIVTGTSSESVTSTSNKTVTINKKEKKNKKKNIYSDDSIEVWNYYIGKMNSLGKTRDKTNERLNCISARLKNYSKEDLFNVIDNVFSSKFMLGDNDENKEYLEIGNFMTSSKKIEKWNYKKNKIKNKFIANSAQSNILT